MAALRASVTEVRGLLILYQMDLIRVRPIQVQSSQNLAQAPAATSSSPVVPSSTINCLLTYRHRQGPGTAKVKQMNFLPLQKAAVARRHGMPVQNLHLFCCRSGCKLSFWPFYPPTAACCDPLLALACSSVQVHMGNRGQGWPGCPHLIPPLLQYNCMSYLQ